MGREHLGRDVHGREVRRAEWTQALDLGGARRLSFLNVGSGTGYFSALCDAAAAAAGSELAPHIGLEREAELAAWARARTADVYYDVGDVYDVVASLRDARSPLRGRFDRVYIGAGVDRAACRVLLRLLAPGGLLVAAAFFAWQFVTLHVSL